MTTFSRAWNSSLESVPANGNLVSQGAQRIRERAVDVRERLEVDHEFGSEAGATSNAGYHKKVTFEEQALDPSIPADTIGLYSKDVAGKTELFWKDPDGNVTQLTHLGFLRILYSNNQWTAAQHSVEYDLGTTSGNITPDLDNGQHFVVTLNGNATIQAPTNSQPGSVVLIRVIQDGIGTRTVGFSGSFTKPAGIDLTASTDPAAQDIYVLYCRGSNLWIVTGIHRDILEAV